MAYNLIVADPPWAFSDKLSMSKVKRGADAQYKGTLSIKDIKELPVRHIAAENAVLALWVPSSMLADGLETMKAWGFEFKQTHIWVKTKKEPLKGLLKIFYKLIWGKAISIVNKKDIAKIIDDFDIGSEILAFGLGRLFRQTHEICLIGTRGNVYNKLENKSQRSVHFGPVTKHSEKPEDLQDMLDKMFPSYEKKIELFARRDRLGYDCFGNECKSTYGQDIRYCLWKIILENADPLIVDAETFAVAEAYIKEQIEKYKPDANPIT
jgi:N6-adenosine-specific RNA methylase IME4